MTTSFWLILSAVLGYGLLHSFLASVIVKAFFDHWLGEQYNRWYRIIFNLVAIITLLLIFGLVLFFQDARIYIIHLPWAILAILFQLLAVITLVVGLHQTGIALFLGLLQLYIPSKVEPPILVTGGLYRYVRHPLYTAGLVIIWLTPVLTWNLLAFNIGLTLYIILGIYFEEHKLRLIYGDAYEEYRRKTPALFPILRILNQKHSQ
jgi:methanethiol S-methyltransferase